MKSEAETVEDYLRELPEERQHIVGRVREAITANLPSGYVEGMQYGMIGYFVPHSIYPAGYQCDPDQPLPFAHLASQKNHVAVYLMCIYSDPNHEKWFRKAWAAAGQKVDMGKSCVRFKKIDEAGLSVIGEAIRRVPVEEFVARYEAVTKRSGKNRKVRKSKGKSNSGG